MVKKSLPEKVVKSAALIAPPLQLEKDPQADFKREEQEQQEKQEPLEEPPLEDSPKAVTPPPSPPSVPRLARVAKLKRLLYPDADTVGGKGRLSFNEVKWEQIGAAYKVKYKTLGFKPTLLELPSSTHCTLMDQVAELLRTSNIDLMLWSGNETKDLIRLVVRYAGDSPEDSKVKVSSGCTMINEELGVSGRADVVISKDDTRLVVVQCKRAVNSYSKGMAQMMLAAETVLAAELRHNESSKACVYGLLAGSVAWTWMRLDSKEGRFYLTSIDAKDVAGGRHPEDGTYRTQPHTWQACDFGVRRCTEPQ
ncbi:hypothetical protein PF010_g14853 [Phytophthora fragariae]|uniref:Uncharacterized protein n=2 Tax=Phytophthora fragariae TaxID=53985 RepID=A0A6G0RGT5_9STRA|nr:hypothetical protein PF010_g14853 [Phytophthora fragariae]KAE9216587.1 hypothetical protein PF004_g14413 [Phytophthora fragariae]KAE9332718.1 hypothetical protein PF008_g14811 [Phytophthora fragariae]